MSLHPHGNDENNNDENEEFAELDARVRRLEGDALTALSARLDVAVLLWEVRRMAADLPECDVPAEPGPPSDAARRGAPAREPEHHAGTGIDTRTGPTGGHGDDPAPRHRCGTGGPASG